MQFHSNFCAINNFQFSGELCFEACEHKKYIWLCFCEWKKERASKICQKVNHFQSLLCSNLFTEKWKKESETVKEHTIYSEKIEILKRETIFNYNSMKRKFSLWKVTTVIKCCFVQFCEWMPNGFKWIEKIVCNIPKTKRVAINRLYVLKQNETIKAKKKKPRIIIIFKCFFLLFVLFFIFITKYLWHSHSGIVATILSTPCMQAPRKYRLYSKVLV